MTALNELDEAIGWVFELAEEREDLELIERLSDLESAYRKLESAMASSPTPPDDKNPTGRNKTMSDYTPTTGVVEDAACFPRDILVDPRPTLSHSDFGRWLATVKAEAWQEGALWAAAECGVIEPDCPPELWLTPGDNPYREGTEI